MHDSSMERMKEFVAQYLNTNIKINVLDVGSCCKHKSQKSYRELFDNDNWSYFGLDLEVGNNVDIVAKSPYDWDINLELYDVVISGQCLEHVKDTKEWIKQIDKYLKPSGLVCIIAPWRWRQHRYPVDCWRILPDGMEFLLKDVCGFEIINIFIKEDDCIGVARKK